MLRSLQIPGAYHDRVEQPNQAQMRHVGRNNPRRHIARSPVLSPDDYVAGQSSAVPYARRCPGIVYPSVRVDECECLAAFRTTLLRELPSRGVSGIQLERTSIDVCSSSSGGLRDSNKSRKASAAAPLSRAASTEIDQRLNACGSTMVSLHRARMRGVDENL